MVDDPLESLLHLEDKYYQEGYDLGVKDGTQAGLIEGRLFGLEKGFEKYATMGALHGRSVIWAARLSNPRNETSSTDLSLSYTAEDGCQRSQHKSAAKLKTPGHSVDSSSTPETLPPIKENTRLEKHIRILYALTEPISLSTENSEESVSDFGDRLKRADGKIKIIEKSLDEWYSNRHAAVESAINFRDGSRSDYVSKAGSSIEDVSNLHARH